MNSRLIRRTSIWLVAAMLMAGCTLPLLATPAPAQPPAIQSSDELLGTSIAQTAAAAQTQTALALPSPTFTPTITRTPTATYTPTPTFIFSFFTATLVPSETSIVPVNAGAEGGGYKFTGKEWTCTVTARVPGKGAVIKQGQTFYAYWTVLNTGTKTWTNNGVDFIYLSGMRMDGRRIQDLPKTVAPGNQITLKIQLTAPKREDTFSTVWTLKVGRRSFCPMKITFDVQ